MSSQGPTTSIHTFTTEPQRWRVLKGFARNNRKASTEAETALWEALRGNRLGARFRRQHAIDRYLVDFVCLRAWLVVEVDGDYHLEAEQAEYDGGRTHALQECGFLVLRFASHDVLSHPEQVLRTIAEHLALLLPQ